MARTNHESNVELARFKEDYATPQKTSQETVVLPILKLNTKVRQINHAIGDTMDFNC